MKESCDNANGNEIATPSGRTYGDEVVGRGQVSKGWDEWVEGVKVAGKRMLKIPAHLAFGACGACALVPPYAKLIFHSEPLGL